MATYPLWVLRHCFINTQLVAAIFFAKISQFRCVPSIPYSFTTKSSTQGGVKKSENKVIVLTIRKIIHTFEKILKP